MSHNIAMNNKTTEISVEHLEMSIAEKLERLLSKSKKLEYVMQTHNPLFSAWKDANLIVKDFIRTRGLIIYGGTAIDMALRMKGSKIYDDETLDIMDLDFYSQNSVIDSGKLAEILYAKGYLEVRVINGLHVQTRRVDIEDSTFIADISYLPPKVFENTPTILYDGMRIVHPDIQKIDIHYSLSFPYLGPPRESIFNRWSKDMKRFNLLDEKYPNVAPPHFAVKLKKITAPLGATSQIIHGFFAYSILYSTYADIMKKHGSGTTSAVISAEFALTGDAMECMGVDYIDVITINPAEALSALRLSAPDIAKTAKYHPYMNYRAPCICAGTVRIHDINGKLLAINTYIHANLKTMKRTTMRIANIQYVLLYFLGSYYIEKNPIYMLYYVSTRRMLTDVCGITAGMELDHQTALFYPSIKTYGGENAGDSYLILRNRLRNSIYKDPLYEKPMNYNVGRAKESSNPPPVFDYSSSPFFEEDGSTIGDSAIAVKKE